MLKHGKYIYVNVGNGYYIKVRILKKRDENSPDRYIPIFRTSRRVRKAKVVKLDDLPVEVRDRLSKSFLL
ncbi:MULTISPECIES: DUF5622 domain-containing protein [Acidianus]|uniref:DUF5622 domain-containing protein n=1 Tax=Candidatus Acidianus copahuensis TaxID=1160895 RepID=A0A031LPY1_9CREN|nr:MULTISPECIES: DUF5622 domain-containing protein [Acidianus]EZQ06800.1 hypothetical protein CM19_05340 [Candidatus Acidianus copahuensis]NON61811.1 DUF5622 domain-containing protein [Acidianus sp. RZ1]